MSYRRTNVVGGGSASVTIAPWEHPVVWECLGKGRYLQAAFCKSAAQLYSAKFGSITLKSLSNIAAEGASIGMLEWSKEIGCRWDESVFRSSAKGGSVDVLKFLKNNDCPMQKDSTLCRIAGAGGHLEALKFLCQTCGCVCDEILLMAAATEGRLEILQYAHAHRAALFVRDSPGWNSRAVCRFAAEKGHIHVLEWAHKTLHEDGLFDARMCEAAASGGRLDVVQYLRGIGCAWDENTCEAAISYGHVDLLKWALNEGCPWSVNDKLGNGETGLHYAESVEMMEFLISRGANKDMVDNDGQTPLYAAALVRAGADVNIADVNGITPLAVATNQDFMKLL